MLTPLQHTRILNLPAPEPIIAGHLDTFFIENHGKRVDLFLDYHASLSGASAKMLERGGRIYEITQGFLIPRRLRFHGVEDIERVGLYQDVDSLPLEHEARVIVDLYNMQIQGERSYFYLLFGHSKEDAELRFHALGVKLEPREGPWLLFSLERDWSPAPPMPARIVPQPRSFHRKFGGNPVSVLCQGRMHHRRLFIGGVDIQPEMRPDIHAVLNLGEQPSQWCKGVSATTCDRWENKGEGSQGMGVEEIIREAEWVIERLCAGQRVLVHCAAGMNRSATICCAVLILLERLSAEAALERLRLHHPWSRPDGHHWLALRWLAQASQTRSPGVLLNDF